MRDRYFEVYDNDKDETVFVNSEDFLDLLMNRLYVFGDFNLDDEYEKDLYSAFENYYRECIDSGMFDGVSDLDVYSIVDNDWVNNLSYVDEDNYKQYNGEDCNTFKEYKEYMQDEGRLASESDSGAIVLIYA